MVRVGEKCSGTLSSQNTSYEAGNGSGKLIVDPRPAPDKHQKLINSRGSLFAHAYHVWSTSVTMTVSYPAHRE